MDKRKNLCLFYGKDTVALRHKLAVWLEKFAAQSDLLLDSADFDASDLTWERLAAAWSIVPLFVTKRLIIVRNVISRGSKDLQQKILYNLASVPESSVVLFIEEDELDPKNALARVLREVCQTSHFPQPSQGMQHKIASDWLAKREQPITPEALTVLIARSGGSTADLDNNLQKLWLYANGTQISKSNVDLLVDEPLESRIFLLVDAIFGHDATKACSLMLKELEFGTAPLQITALLISQVRRISIVQDSKNAVALAGVPSFVAQKIMLFAKKWSKDETMAYWVTLMRAEIALKTGMEALPVMLTLV